MTKQTDNQIESRFLARPVKIEQRAAGDDKKPVIVGYAAVFETLSENLGGFREKIAVGAFDAVMGDDVRATYNHDANIVLGRSSSGTLRLSLDAVGLRYEVDPPDTQAARDLLVSMERGDIAESSFRFMVEDDDWSEDDDGRVVRTIKAFRRLIDVSPVTYPAYPDAKVAQRSLESWREEHNKEPDYLAEQRANALLLAEHET